MGIVFIILALISLLITVILIQVIRVTFKNCPKYERELTLPGYIVITVFSFICFILSIIGLFYYEEII